MLCHVSAWWAQATGEGSGSIEFLLDICLQLILLCLLAPWNHWQSGDVEIRPRRAGPRRENWPLKKKAAGRTHPISASLAVRVEKSAYNAGRTPDGLEDGYWSSLTPPFTPHDRIPGSVPTDCLSKYSRSVWCRYSPFSTIESEPPRSQISNMIPRRAASDGSRPMRKSRPATVSY